MSFFCLALMALSGAEALSLHARDQPAVISLPIWRQKDIESTQYQKRATAVTLPFTSSEAPFSTFLCNISLGTPPQQVQVQLDPGSSYLTVAPSNSSLCANLGSEDSSCQPPESFNVSASSTFKSTGYQFNMTYPSEHMASGEFANDVLTIGSTTLNMELAIDYTGEGGDILGLGYALDDAFAYSLPQALAENGDINSAAYSLWADDLTGNSGTLLFGGVNTAKYSGELHTMTIPAVNGRHFLPTVLVTDVSVQGDSSATSSTSTPGLPAYMMLDSNLEWSYLPDSLVEKIYQDIGAQFVGHDQQTGIINDCSILREQNYNITFTFTDFAINIPLSDLGSLFSNNDTCSFTIVPSGGEAPILGSNFLRAVYTVVDLTNNEISLAQRNFTSGPDNILEIGNGTAAISGAVTVSVTATATVPTTAIKAPYLDSFPLTSSASLASSSTSTGAAPTASTVNNKLTAGLMAGLLLAL